MDDDEEHILHADYVLLIRAVCHTVTCLHCARFTDQLRPDGGTLRRWPDTNTHPHFIIYSPECFIVSGNAVTAYKRLNIGIFPTVSPSLRCGIWNLTKKKC